MDFEDSSHALISNDLNHVVDNNWTHMNLSRSAD